MDDTRVSCSFILKKLLNHLTHAVTFTTHAKRAHKSRKLLRRFVKPMYSGISAEATYAMNNGEICVPHYISRIEVRIVCISV